ncbi:hypothetical protein P3G55_03065 [Leptospira sp. 96542]|nr:hypothetical protein [Leptospira sp. 96542]
MQKILFFIYPTLLLFSVHCARREDPIAVICVWIVPFLYFFYLKNFIPTISFRMIFLYSVFLRLLMLGSQPIWSDDIYRYLWDGLLLQSGVSPYLAPPNLVFISELSSGNEAEYYLKNMNSAGFLSVYPAVLQSVFYFVAIVQTMFSHPFLITQCIFVLIEMVTMALIPKILPNQNSGQYWLYFGNPIVIVEGVSQMHPEVLFVFLLALSIKFKNYKNLFLFLLIQCKITGLVFVFNLFKTNKVKFFVFLFLTIIVLVLTVFQNFLFQLEKGFGLFFHSFRYGGILEPGFYYPLSLLKLEYLSGIFSLGFAFTLLLYLFLKKKVWEDVDWFFVSYFIYLLFTPVFHLWYNIPLYFLVLFAPQYERIVLALTFLSLFSYFLYSHPSWEFYRVSLVFFVLGVYGKKIYNHICKTASPWFR